VRNDLKYDIDIIAATTRNDPNAFHYIPEFYRHNKDLIFKKIYENYLKDN
jgi:hypothetical protein